MRAVFGKQVVLHTIRDRVIASGKMQSHSIPLLILPIKISDFRWGVAENCPHLQCDVASLDNRILTFRDNVRLEISKPLNTKTEQCLET
jgi:hypothetical protein